MGNLIWKRLRWNIIASKASVEIAGWKAECQKETPFTANYSCVYYWHHGCSQLGLFTRLALQPTQAISYKNSKMKSMKGRPISEIEFQKMLDTVEKVVGEEVAKSWDYVLRSLWESALRIEELMHVFWDQPGTIRPICKNEQHPILEIPAAMQKNDTHETIPMLPGLEALLLETSESQWMGWGFNPKSLQLRLGRKIAHKRPDADWVAKVVSRIGKEAEIIVEEADERTGKNIKYASDHDLRRSYGERLRNAGVLPLVICRVMRHSSWETRRKHYVSGDVQKDTAVLKRILSEKWTLRWLSDYLIPKDKPSCA